MSTTLFYKFKDDPQIYWGKHTCTTHLRNKRNFDLDRQYIIPSTDEYPIPNYACRGSLSYSLDDIEWIEYRLICSEDREVVDKYSEVLWDSSLRRYFNWDHGWPRYRFTLDEPFARNLFLISVLRYAEEMETVLDEVISGSMILSADETIAMISTCATGGHGVFKPENYLRGVFHRMDKFLNLMLESDVTTIRDVINGKRGLYPRDLVIHDYTMSSVYHRTLDDWYDFFNAGENGDSS